LFRLNQILEEEKVKNLSSIVLAFIGDAVYSLFVREKLVSESDAKTGELNKLSSQIVCAKAQAKKIDEIMPLLTDEEKDVFRRARNAKKGAKAKNASVVEYNKSTGFEAVIGFLYLTGKYERIDKLLNYEVDNEN
jgi:ribonuclease-3 family protein